jgi:hypothetical protein
MRQNALIAFISTMLDMEVQSMQVSWTRAHGQIPVRTREN